MALRRPTIGSRVTRDAIDHDTLDHDEDESPLAHAREIDDRFAGQDIEPAEDPVEEATAGKPSQQDTGVLGGIDVEELKSRTPGDDLLGGGADEPADPRPSSETAVDVPDAKEAGVFDVGGAPSDQTNASPAHGKGSVAAGEPLGPKTFDEAFPYAEKGSDGQPFIGPQTHLQAKFDHDFGLDGRPVLDEPFPEPEPEPEPAPAPSSGGGKPSNPDDDPNSGEVISGHDDPDPPPPGHEGPDVPSAASAPVGGDDGRAPLPPELEAQLKGEVARFRRLRPDTGDGTTDPSEIDSPVDDGTGDLPDRADIGEGLFGQPNPEAEPEGGSNANANRGADCL
jgi:hypothetical protein